jgi:hypothetical protein
VLPSAARDVSISIGPEDGEKLVSCITQVHRGALDESHARRPIDAKPDERRPNWIGDK